MIDFSHSKQEHNAAIEEAAAYLANVPPGERPAPLVPAMREMFGLTSIGVCDAIRRSYQLARLK